MHDVLSGLWKVPFRNSQGRGGSPGHFERQISSAGRPQDAKLYLFGAVRKDFYSADAASGVEDEAFHGNGCTEMRGFVKLTEIEFSLFPV